MTAGTRIGDADAHSAGTGILARMQSLGRSRLGKAISLGGLVLLVLVARVAGRPIAERRPLAGRPHPYGPDLIRPASGIIHINLATARSPHAPSLDAIAKATAAVHLSPASAAQQADLGEVEDLAIDGDGDVFAVDRDHGVVRVLGRQGEFLATIGNPRELQYPLSVAVDAAGNVYVGSMNRRISVYARDGTGYSLRRTFSLPFAAIDLCAIGADLVVHGVDVHTGQILHRFSQDGVRLASFGQTYSTRHWLVMRKLSTGRIACFPSTRTIVYAPRDVLPEVRAFSLDGKELWMAVLDGYRGAEVAEQGTGMVARVPWDRVDRVDELIPFRSNEAMLQVASVVSPRRPASRARTSYRSILIDVHSGAVHETTSDLPEIGAANVTGTEYVEITRHPSTQISVVQRPKAEVLR